MFSLDFFLLYLQGAHVQQSRWLNMGEIITEHCCLIFKLKSTKCPTENETNIIGTV